MKKPNIVIIGQGEIGRAIHEILKKKKHAIRIECWDIDANVCPVRKELSVIVPKADILFLCIPSWTIRQAVTDLQHLLKKTTIIVSLSKGLDRMRFKTVDELLTEVFPASQPTVLLSGPMLAEEIMLGKPAAATISTKSKRAGQAITDVFSGTVLHVSLSSDMRGVALCGILKNIYTIGLSAAQEHAPGDNYIGLFMHQALREMCLILERLGGNCETVSSYAGIGDLIATGFSNDSKNHAYGVAIARTGRVSFESEGSVSIQPMLARLKKRTNDLPLFMTIASVVQRKKKTTALIHFFD